MEKGNKTTRARKHSAVLQKEWTGGWGQEQAGPHQHNRTPPHIPQAATITKIANNLFWQGYTVGEV